MSRPNRSTKTNIAKPEYDILKAVEKSNYLEVDLVLHENPFDINKIDQSSGLTPLHIAAGDANLGMVKYLLNKQFLDATIRDKFDRDPLDIAINIGHKGTIDHISAFMFPKSFG